MEKIQSFCVDHNKLLPGVYISRIDDDITTFDLRFIKPNTPPYLPSKVMHTIEHLFATYARNSEYSENIIYFGPMGCKTGFYFLTKGLSNKENLKLIKEITKKCKNHNGEIPGNKKIECGNYKYHDKDKAKEYLEKYYEIIKNKKEKDLYY